MPHPHILPITQRHLQAWDADWKSAVAELLGSVHPVDQDALLIWLQLHPLHFAVLAAENVGEEAAFTKHFQVRGQYRLAQSADTSHRFLFSHQYWPAAKKALIDSTPANDLLATVRAVASSIAGPTGLTLPIAVVALMTLRQAGPAFLDVPYTPPASKESPDKVLAQRAGDQPKSLWGMVTGGAGKMRITMDERNGKAWFPLLSGQHITTAAELDKRPYHLQDDRCYEGMGPIPVDCRSGSCGTCWVGVLGGRENCEPITEYEQKRMDYFGYAESEFRTLEGSAPERPLVRLACQTVMRGSCSIVIPEWNGVFGEVRRKARSRQE